ncbi:MAG TPA: ABC transporter permease [Thermomicrobiales bacterium]|nr:ABC transporter permease [Thermomicrobiales bacterium]
MIRYLRGRIPAAILVLLGASLLVFSMLHFLPGDPVLIMMASGGGGIAGAQGTEISQEQYEAIRYQLGLDRPLYVQFGAFVWNALHGDLGRSFRSNQTVAELIANVLPNTFRLALLSLGISCLVGVTLGTLAAVRHNTWIDSATMAFALFGVAMPNFWFGLVLISVFALNLRWLPATGAGGWSAIILPALALGMRSAAVIARLTRASLLEVLSEGYLTTARAKGLPERIIVVRHSLRNALIPVVTIAGLQFGDLLAGAVVIEVVFARPGLGNLAVKAIENKDFPVVQGTVLVVATAYVVTNLLTDVVYALLDPRITYT